MPRFLLLLVFLTPLAQAELYKWTDAQGRVHFGDQPPEAAKAQRMAAPVNPPPSNTAAPAAGASANSSADVLQRQKNMLRVLDEDKRARAKQQAEADAEAAKLKRACNGLREQKRILSGGRVYTRDDKGEPVFFSDAQIDAERAKVEAQLKQYCL